MVASDFLWGGRLQAARWEGHLHHLFHKFFINWPMTLPSLRLTPYSSICYTVRSQFSLTPPASVSASLRLSPRQFRPSYGDGLQHLKG
jgi:hypothetical protein